MLPEYFSVWTWYPEMSAVVVSKSVQAVITISRF